VRLSPQWGSLTEPANGRRSCRRPETTGRVGPRAREAPRILALDEPLGALDALTRIEMQRLVEQVWLANGFTAILVTHDVTEAVTLGDRIVVIDHGAIAADILVGLTRPRLRGSAEFAGVEAKILGRLLAATD